MSDERRDVLEGLEGFTPGPWRPMKGTEWFIQTAHDEHIGPLAEMRGNLAYPSGDPRVGKAKVANARAIARVPDLIEEVEALRVALRESTDRLECHYSDDEVNAQVRRNRALLPETEKE